jgi:ubiquitin carboxyl-terminal hydrolase 1
MSDEDEADKLQSPGLSDAVKTSAQARLKAVQTALEEDDFAEKTLANKCHIPSKNRMTTTKSRQAVIARAPQCLVVHINRSLFDEMTGMLKKNYAAVKFPKTLDMNDWCLGTQLAKQSEESSERWVTDPSESMLPRPGEAIRMPSRQYELRAIITHYGRHENGHYICYRKYPTSEFPAPVPDEVLQAEGDKEKPERWYRLSDDDVQMVSEGHVMSQGGAFMLFYEAVDTKVSSPSDYTTKPESVRSEVSESVSAFTMSENMSTTSTVTDADSTTSRATSVSTPDRTALPVEDNGPDSMVPKSFSEVDNDHHISTELLGSPSAITA